ncbi:hypothetical protein TPHA_0I02080 [Tetrapisispora phaffii CBS 4417]|uniref:Uncharacterized protein n=1 Tax=Tetrapisispora phaffii (strain ATCC 24235 / CBS 4417 / NBRC 1672 / NRRL Y-8282 / UCD 70-5) TaxID=1071381 RepID=G8BXT4_TETPH|nr:hypothetical protein TPHA_0I02080 [Tetrapisispora phaffii CBS 4417]CCE64712.1 hypothetical protein TPHA_0I02080 [Tetrapisispora phaffii CBS 4417]
MSVPGAIVEDSNNIFESHRIWQATYPNSNLTEVSLTERDSLFDNDEFKLVDDFDLHYQHFMSDTTTSNGKSSTESTIRKRDRITLRLKEFKDKVIGNFRRIKEDKTRKHSGIKNTTSQNMNIKNYKTDIDKYEDLFSDTDNMNVPIRTDAYQCPQDINMLQELSPKPMENVELLET